MGSRQPWTTAHGGTDRFFQPTARAGRPDQKLKAWGSYPDWSALVRGAIVWAGQPDPEMARESVGGEAEPDAAQLRGLIVGWQEIDPEGEGKTAARVVNTLAERQGVLSGAPRSAGGPF